MNFNHDGDGSIQPDLDCYVNTETFNQLLQCCFDPSHLEISPYENINMPTDYLNDNSHHASHSDEQCSHSHDRRDEYYNVNNNNETSSVASSTIKTPNSYSGSSNIKNGNTKPNLNADILTCCSPIDLNSNSMNENSKLSKSDNDEVSEMVLLNNFFTACCNDIDNENLTNSSFNNLSDPVFSTELYNTSSIRDSLKAENESSNKLNGETNAADLPSNKHHHHLLHLHHHNPNDSSKSHTHDIIFHHHDSDTCSHNHSANHHHHLHFQNEINGKKIKHDFILPDCKGLPNAKNNEVEAKVKEETSDVNKVNCTDFLTESICHSTYPYKNLDLDAGFGLNPDRYMDRNEHYNFNYNPLKLSLPSQRSGCNHNHNHSHSHSHHKHSPFDDSQQHEDHHHHLQHNHFKYLAGGNVHNKHFHVNKNFKHDVKENIGNEVSSRSNSNNNNRIYNHGSLHTNNSIQNLINDDSHLNTEIKVKIESPETILYATNICKWNNCNTELNPEDIDKHLYENHLQYLPLSPGFYTHDELKNNSNAINNLRTLQSNNEIHCGWDDCNFTTFDIDKFLEHVPEHTESFRKQNQNQNQNQHQDQDQHQTSSIIPHSSSSIKLSPVLKTVACTSGNEDSTDTGDESNIHICKWVDPDNKIICGSIFGNTGDLTNHIISDHIRSGKSSYVCHWKDCDRCDKPFSQRQKIIRHLNTHTKHKPFQCKICNKKFSLDLMLKQHMRIHTGEKPYKCDICGKTFKTSSSLTIHLRIHTGDKPMICKICGKGFNESSNLNKHMKIHFRKFKCKLCMKSFDCEAKFNRHQLVCQKKAPH